MDANKGLAILRKKFGRWEFTGSIPGIIHNLHDSIEENNGILWFISSDFGVGRIKYSEDEDPVQTQPVIETMYDQSAFKVSGFIYVNDHVAFCTDRGLKRWEPKNSSLVQDFSLGELFADSTSLIYEAVQVTPDRRFIFCSINRKMEIGTLHTSKDGKHSWQPFPVLKRIDLSTVMTIYPEVQIGNDRDILWIGTSEGLIRYEPGVSDNYKQDYSALIRKVTVNQDSLLCNGDFGADIRKNERRTRQKSGVRIACQGS